MALVVEQPRQRTEYFRLDEQDALLAEIQPEGLLDVIESGQDQAGENPRTKCPALKNENFANCEHGAAVAHNTSALHGGAALTAKPSQEEFGSSAAPCFATAVAAAVAAISMTPSLPGQLECQERRGPAHGFGMLKENPSKPETRHMYVGDAESDVCAYYTPRGCDSMLASSTSRASLAVREDGFSTPRSSGYECGSRCLMPETNAKSTQSPEWTSRRSSDTKSVDGRAHRISGHGRLAMNCSPADCSLLVKTQHAAGRCFEDASAWHGWQLQATPCGAFYFCHPASGARQWDVPPELTEFLGEWLKVDDGHVSYWSNDRLGASCWKDPRSCASIHQAALDGNLAYLQLYLFARGSIHATNFKGRSALHNACAAGQTEVIAWLLSNQANVHLCDHTYSTALHWACRYGHASAVELLLQAGADVDACNMLGDTPAHEAAGLGQVKALEQLIDAGANLNLKNAESHKPVEVAAVRGWPEAQALLESSENMDQPLWEMEQTSEQRRWQGLEEEPLSPALKIVRAARPVLRGVQWLANRVLGERPVNLEHGNSHTFDCATGKWEENDCASEASDESGDSAIFRNEQWPMMRLT